MKTTPDGYVRRKSRSAIFGVWLTLCRINFTSPPVPPVRQLRTMWQCIQRGTVDLDPSLKRKKPHLTPLLTNPLPLLTYPFPLVTSLPSPLPNPIMPLTYPLSPSLRPRFNKHPQGRLPHEHLRHPLNHLPSLRQSLPRTLSLDQGDGLAATPEVVGRRCNGPGHPVGLLRDGRQQKRSEDGRLRFFFSL